jgi:ATP-dependent RNA helicase HelY
LKIVNRKLYMVSVALAELAKAKFTAAEIQDPYPAVLEILAYAIRVGLDTPEKIAFTRHRLGMRTRVGLHQASIAKIGTLPPQLGASFRDVLQHVQAMMMFDPVDDD